MFQQTISSGYSTAIEVNPGGRIQCRMTLDSGSGTVSLKQAYFKDSKATASNYTEYSTSTTVSATTSIGIQPGISWLVFHVTSGSPTFTCELFETDSHIVVKDTEVTPS